MMKKGFTLAEIMIALVVIGVITSILLPVAFNNVPNENVMKFKKGNATLAKVVNELATSGECYTPGDLGKKKDGNLVDSPTYLCETIAEVLNVKSTNCSKVDEGIETSHIHIAVVNGVDNTSHLRQVLDERCKEYQKDEIITTDGITYFQVSPYHHFAVDYSVGNRLFGNPGHWNSAVEYDENGRYVPGSTRHDSPFDLIYKVFCMDVDGINQGEEPFGYGIRADGKLFLGVRAQEWMEKSIQEKE